MTKDHNIVEKSQAEGQRQRTSSVDAGGELRCSTHPAVSQNFYLCILTLLIIIIQCIMD